MHRCPKCDYALGALRGAPAEPFGEFTEDVRCPECSFLVPKGARLLTGSSTVAGSQPLTTRRRTGQILLAAAPAMYLLQMGIEGTVGLVRKGTAGFSTWDAVKASGLVVVGLIVWTAWRRWTPSADTEGRAPASFDVRWLAVPGALDIFAGGEPTRHAATDVHRIIVTSPDEPLTRRRADDRMVAALTVSTWQRDASGRRADLRQAVIFLDTGAAPGPPGRDGTSTIIEAGDAIARGLRRTIGLAAPVHDDAENAPDARPSGTEAGTLAVEGALHAQAPWPAPGRAESVLLGIPTILGLSLAVVGAVLILVRTAGPGAAPSVPTWMWVMASIGAVATVSCGLLWWWLMLRFRLRGLARCRWDVGDHGIRATERRVDRRGNTVDEFVRDVPGGRIAGIEVRLEYGRIRLVATSHDGRVLAGLALDEIPEGGAESLAQRIRERVWTAAR
ncbi:MAG: hypothetical protein FGM39_09520 [Phycisphaerales bacterium]|nr:hypothetical protein [Phycisphaerales bacterium]